VTNDDFMAATLITSGVPAPADAGTVQSFPVGSLQPDTEYHFSAKVSDEAGNVSTLSNPASASTVDLVPPASFVLSASTGGFVYELRPATAISSSGDLLATYSKAMVTDGNPSTFWSTPPRPSMQPEHITIDLGSSMNIGQVVIRSRADTAVLFPLDFDIGVSTDNVVFTTVHSETNFAATANTPYPFSFTPVLGRYIRIDISRTVRYGNNYYAQIAEVEGYEAMPGGVLLTWNAPGDNDNQGTAATYEIHYSDTNITEANFDFATPVPNPPAPQPAGTPESVNVQGLGPGTYFFRIRTKDEAENSSLSTEATITISP
jgi:hypothetical protein